MDHFLRETYKRLFHVLALKGANSMNCQKCGQETFLPFQCPYCGDKFCSVHRLPENHNCSQIETARAPKQEDNQLIQRPKSYEYTVSFGTPSIAKSRIYFGPRELRDLAIATLLVVGVGLSLSIYFYDLGQIGWTPLVLFSLLLTISFLIHEIAHKIAAQRRGLWAEFRLTLWGAVLTLVSVFSPFKIIAPGAIMIAGSAGLREIAQISIVGPATNLLLSTLFLGLSFVPSLFSSLFMLVALINAYMALFNLIPIGILDGSKIFNWNKKVWALAFVSSLTLSLVSFIRV